MFGIGFALCATLAAGAPGLDGLVGQPADLSEWATTYRAGLRVQERPEAVFALRRTARIDRAYRPVSALLAGDTGKRGEPWPPQQGDWQLFTKDSIRERGELPPAPKGVLRSALLWDGHVAAERLELRWATNPPAPETVELRVYPTNYGWFGWQTDLPVTAKPEVSVDGLTWVYRGDWRHIDMVAAFAPEGAEVPRIAAYGPEKWKKIDLEIEWGVDKTTSKKDYSGRIEGYFGLVGSVSPLQDDAGTETAGFGWTSKAAERGRRGVSVQALYIQPANDERVKDLPKHPYGHPEDTRLTVWTKAGSFTFLVRDLDKGPILAPEFGFYVAKKGEKRDARTFAKELAANNRKSIRQMTREHPEATREEALAQIKLPMLPPGTKLPEYEQVDDPPMSVELPDKGWTDAWRMVASQLKNGELTYMHLALEAPRPIHAMDAVGLHEQADKWLKTFLDRPGAFADGDFLDGSGNFCHGKLFHGTATVDAPDSDTYELVHNGGTGRILYDLADHYFLTGDAGWFKKNMTRMQAAADWIVRQRERYLEDVPNRKELQVAGLQPPQHISDTAWGASDWRWYTNIDAWYCQGLRRFGEALKEFDPQRGKSYVAAAEAYRKAIRKAVDRSIALAPVMKVRNGTYRSYIPSVYYCHGPSVGQVVQLAMTDDDWALSMTASIGVPSVDDPRLDGFLDVYEEVLIPTTTYLFGGDRYKFLTEKRRAAGLPAEEDWFWGGESSQLGYSYLANVYLQRDEIPGFLRQFTNNYAAYVMPSPRYYFLEQFMNHVNQGQMKAYAEGRYRDILNGHSLAYFMEQFRSLLVWEDGDDLWLAKATPRAWLEQGKKVSVRNAPSCFGTVAYEIVSDVAHGRLLATVTLPARRAVRSVLLRFRHPEAAPIKSVTVDGKAWKGFDAKRELVRLHGLKGTVKVEARY